jgi:hypothetical protein
MLKTAPFWLILFNGMRKIVKACSINFDKKNFIYKECVKNLNFCFNKGFDAFI